MVRTGPHRILQMILPRDQGGCQYLGQIAWRNDKGGQLPWMGLHCWKASSPLVEVSPKELAACLVARSYHLDYMEVLNFCSRTSEWFDYKPGNATVHTSKMQMLNPLVDRALIIGCRCHSVTIRGLGTLWYMVTNIDWMAVRVDVDGMHMICVSILTLECLWAARVEAW